MSTLTRLLITKFCFLSLSLPTLVVWPQFVQADVPSAPATGQIEMMTPTTAFFPPLSTQKQTQWIQISCSEGVCDPRTPVTDRLGAKQFGSTETEEITSTDTLSSTSVASPLTYVKGLYLTYHAVGHEGLRTHAFDLIENTELNAVVIDIKGDLGVLTYKSDVVTATAIGANDAPTIRDWPAFMQYLDEHDIYAIARIVVFKDNYLARAHPEWAVKDASGELWVDREKLPWVEAFHEGVWDYNIALAVEAAQRGFDEIQFDYVRFPTDGSIGNIVYSQDVDVPDARKNAINGFLAKADAALAPYQTKLAVDVFGYTTWHDGDFRIGQDLSDMVRYLDVLSPMLYPSTFDHGLVNMPEYDFAVAFPYEIVYESMLRAIPKVKAINPDIIVRPWIQDFPDYNFDRRTYTPDEVREQMFGVYDTGGGGWMLWDPRIKYTSEALVTNDTFYPANETGEIMVLRYQNFGDGDTTGEELETRSLTGFRQDLEQLWAAGYYPVNLRDLAVGNWNYRLDIEQLQQNGLPPVQADDLLSRNLHYVPEGKRPIVLTFDGSHVSQYRLLDDGSLDPNSAIGVLYDFHLEHPADWPMRATFFVQPEVDDRAYLLFGQPEFAEQKLQNLVDWGMEVGSYMLDTVDLSTSTYQEIRRQLDRNKELIESTIPDYQVDSLALPLDKHSRLENPIRRSFYDNLLYDYYAVATKSDKATPSPHTGIFDSRYIPRIQAIPEAIEAWLAFYQDNPDVYYVAAGVIPEVRPAQ